MGRTKYPKTIAAVKAAEGNQWAIGDALLEEVGAPAEHGVNVGTRAAIKECAVELERKGHEYKPEELRRLRDTAFAFPEARRRSSLSFAVHREAGSQEALTAALKHYDKKVVTVREVREYKKAIKEISQQQRQELVADAQVAREQAEKEGTEEAQQAAVEAEEKVQRAIGGEEPEASRVSREAVDRQQAYFQFENFCLKVAAMAESSVELLEEWDYFKGYGYNERLEGLWQEALTSWDKVLKSPPEERHLKSVE